MTTARDMINGAGRLNRVLGQNMTFTDAEASEGLRRLNSMLDFWSIERLMVYQITENSFTWPSNTASRTIGSGGQIAVTRPTKIHSAYFRDSGSNDYPVMLIEEKEVYDSLTPKTTAGFYPDYLFCDYAYPLASLFVWGVPSAALTCVLKSWKQLQSFATLDTVLSLPPGYQDAIEYNLAVRTAPLDGVTSLPDVKDIAAQTKRAIKGINLPAMVANLDFGRTSPRRTIYTG